MPIRTEVLRLRPDHGKWWSGLLVAGGLLHSGCDRRPAPGDAGTTASPMVAVARAIETVSRTGRGLPGPTATADDREELRRLDDASGHTPLWLTAKGDVRPVGRDALQRLVKAESEGLRPEDYAATQLDTLARQTDALKAADPQVVARLDAGLRLAVLRYLRDTHVGRVDPRSIGFAVDAARERHDCVSLLGTAVREGSLDEIVNELAPPLEQYRLVHEALARYRGYLNDSLASQPLQLPVPLKVGQAAPGLDALARRLALLGDLPGVNAGGQVQRYHGPLVEAVRRFQERHA